MLFLCRNVYFMLFEAISHFYHRIWIIGIRHPIHVHLACIEY
jgi:hypothetical protein